MPRLSRLSRSIEGHVAIVTGAASGMGRATAELFADEGAKVAAVDLGDTSLDDVVAGITAAGGTARAFACDLGEAEAIAPLVDAVVAAFGRLDVLVNNAGVSALAPIDAAEADYEAVWSRTLTVNLAAQARLVRAALPHLRVSPAGRIVNVASTEGLGATAGVGAYTASKHGVVGLTRSLAVELGPTGITVNCICPGPIRTGMTAAIPEEHKRKFARRRVPLRRYGEPEEVAHATLAFVLPAASYVNGAILPVDGGMIAQNT